MITITVYPVPGRFINGYPAVAHEVDVATAELLVATGAFTESPPEPSAPPAEPEAMPSENPED